jgi:hypothetical protein
MASKAMIDTLKLSKRLQEAATEAKEAEALRESQIDYVTRDYFDAKLSELKLELQKFIIVTFVIVAIAQILVAKLWH